MNGVLKYVRTQRGFMLFPSDDMIFQHKNAVEGVTKEGSGNRALSAGICIIDVKDGELRCEVLGDSISLRDERGESLKHLPEDAEMILDMLILGGHQKRSELAQIDSAMHLSPK